MDIFEELKTEDQGESEWVCAVREDLRIFRENLRSKGILDCSELICAVEENQELCRVHPRSKSGSRMIQNLSTQ
jgi:hypothetical protein